MKTQLEKDFEEVLAEMEAMPAEKLAAELREYRERYSASAKLYPRLGEVAFSVEKSSRPLSTRTTSQSLAKSWSKLFSGVVLAAGSGTVLAAGIALLAQRGALKAEEEELTSNEYTPEEEPVLEAVPDEKDVLVDQPDFGMVA